MLRRSIHEVDPRAGQQNSHRALAPADADELDPRAGAAELSLMMLRRSIHEVDPRAGQQNSHRALAPADDDELDPRAGAAKNLRRHAEVYAPSVHQGTGIMNLLLRK